MEAGLHFLGAGDLCGKIIAVQGVGNVGEPLIGFLLGKKVSKIFACDINPKLVEKVKQKYAGKNLEVKAVSPEDTWIFQVEADIFSPNATGAIINPRTITQLKAKIICGAANNQLEDASCDDKSLQKRGIFYIPDFLTNRMGIVNAANEQYGYVKNDPLFERHLDKNWEHSIYRTALKVLDQSRQTGETTCQVATRIADELSLQNHPIFGHRGQQIINSLVENRWHER
jgi:leucine dehydrogenase